MLTSIITVSKVLDKAVENDVQTDLSIW